MIYTVGADVGGTAIKCGVVNEEGKILSSVKLPTPEAEKIEEKISEAARGAVECAGLEMKDIASIGVGMPGICDPSGGIAVSCPNIPNLKNKNICAALEKNLGVEAYIDNDANCAALGEFISFGTGENFIFVTLGTGIGGGIITDGKLLRGINGGAGEIGHMTFRFGGEKCGCGRHGCWERYASVSALSRRMREAGFPEANGRTAFEAALRGSKAAKKVLDTWLTFVAEGICTLVNIFQPDTVVIGGGVSREGDTLLRPIREYAAKYSMTAGLNLPQTRIEASRLFNGAGLVGAAALYTQK